MANAPVVHPLCRAQQIIDCLDDGVLLVDREWTITSITPLCLKMIRSQEDWVGKSLWHFLPVNSLYSPDTVHSIQAAFEASQMFEFESLYTQSIDRWFRFSLRPTETGMTVFLRDVTDRHAMAALHLRDLNDAVTSLVSLLAHEINNPLQALTNLIVIAREHCKEASIEELLESAECQLRRIGVATNDVLLCGSKKLWPDSSARP